jgi:glycosyltransferase involved in cell wall biosynthesis
LSIEVKLSDKKIKVLTISDHPLSPSGVGTQTRYVCEALLKTGRYQLTSIGGAIKHNDYNPTRTEEYGDDWVIFPVDGYGNKDMVRSIIRNTRPDLVWFMTDPRFWGWLWEMENEIRPLAPMIYYHVWDNKPYPRYNKNFYESNDVIATISKVTDDIVRNVTPEVETVYLPHAVEGDVFLKRPGDQVEAFKKNSLPVYDRDKDKFIVFWNNRNARRKQSGTLIFWFKEFLDQVGHDKTCLIMHTDPKDQYGQDLEQIIRGLNIDDGQVLFSRTKYPPDILSMMYNMADCTVNISDAEGFGLATLESLSCETPIIVNMTGGLQEQVTDGTDWFGIGIEPSSKSIIGSQDVPYIYEDRIAKEDFLAALHKMYNMTPQERAAIGKAGRAHVDKNYNFENFCSSWVKLMDDTHEKHGSWENRKNHQAWKLAEVK